MNRRITVEVAYFEPGKPFLKRLELSAPVTAEDAIQLSGVLAEYSSLERSAIEVGIFSKRTTLDAELSDGDRVEIYRLLQMDPKQARRLRAEAKKKKKQR